MQTTRGDEPRDGQRGVPPQQLTSNCVWLLPNPSTNMWHDGNKPPNTKILMGTMSSGWLRTPGSAIAGYLQELSSNQIPDQKMLKVCRMTRGPRHLKASWTPKRRTSGNTAGCALTTVSRRFNLPSTQHHSLAAIGCANQHNRPPRHNWQASHTHM